MWPLLQKQSTFVFVVGGHQVLGRARQVGVVIVVLVILGTKTMESEG